MTFDTPAYGIVIVRTPMRISFFGGGTDYPDYYLREGGQVLATSIDKYSYITLNPLTQLVDQKYRISYSRHEGVNEIDEIQHPAVRAVLKHYGVTHGINLNYTSDLPARTGLGSSSCFTVSLVHALHAFFGQAMSREKMAEEAIHIEQKVIGENVGSQDQYMSAMGGLRHVRFERDGSIHSQILAMRPERKAELEGNLMLLYTNIRRFAHEVLDEQVASTKKKTLDSDLKELSAFVDRGRDILQSGKSLDEFGELLHEGWLVKKKLSSKITNPAIDEAYETARTTGALGGKLLGAGGGGFLLLYVPKEKQQAVRDALGLYAINFKLDGTGSTLLYLN